MCTSYPFLRLAQRYNVDYGTVLCCADAMKYSSSDNNKPYPNFYWWVKAANELPDHVKIEIALLVRPPVGLETGPG